METTKKDNDIFGETTEIGSLDQNFKAFEDSSGNSGDSTKMNVQTTNTDDRFGSNFNHENASVKSVNLDNEGKKSSKFEVNHEKIDQSDNLFGDINHDHEKNSFSNFMHEDEAGNTLTHN